MNLVNLTPHELVIHSRDGSGEPPLRLASSGNARVAVERREVDEIGGVVVYAVEYGEIEGLPAPAPGHRYIVSLLCAQAARASGRDCRDLYTPGELIRDAEGRVVGCRGLSAVAPRRDDGLQGAILVLDRFIASQAHKLDLESMQEHTRVVGGDDGTWRMCNPPFARAWQRIRAAI